MARWWSREPTSERRASQGKHPRVPATNNPSFQTSSRQESNQAGRRKKPLSYSASHSSKSPPPAAC
jgi:hypothetical protein